MNMTMPSGKHSLLRCHGILFIALVVVCVLSAAAYLAHVLQQQQPLAATPTSMTASVAVQDHLPPCNCPYMLFRNTQLDTNFGAVATLPLEALGGLRTMTALRCDRVHFAAGQGLCLTAKRGMFTSYSAVSFGADFRPRHTFPLNGIPSRTRVSPDGRYAAYTIFVAGHSYATGNFSTRTALIDTASDSEFVTDLEQFEVWRDGKVMHAPDFNFWGVTFARDSNRFYATLATGGTPYLVEGNIASRTVRILYKDVECPSLSPDNTRIVFKRLQRNRGWQIHLLDLATMTDMPLVTETRSIDDQVEWLDDRHILYTPMVDAPSGENVWLLSIDGSEPPRLLLSRAYSVAVVR
jgi:hypothetical protein